MSSEPQKHPLSSLVQGFTHLLADTEFYIPEAPAADAVRIVTPLQGMQKKCSITFWAGLVDGEFPAQEVFNFLQPKKAGRRLTDGGACVDRARHIFYQILNATCGTLF